MRTGDDYAASSGGGGGGGMGGELADFGTYLGAAPGGGGTRWGSAQGGPTWGRTTPQHMMYTRFHHDASNNSYEAEDVIGGYSEPSSRNVPRGGGAGTGSAGSGGRSGLYYSPPGTSYTIVERPSSGMHSYRDRDREYHTSSKTGTSRTGYPVQTSSRSSTLNSMNKKRPISPEQVLKLFGNSHTTTSAPSGAHSLTVSNSKDRSSRRSPASSPASTTHQVYNPASRSQYQAPSIHELVTRTVTMSRDPPDGTHGFGICVKGGKDAGVGVYISRVEEGSVAERSGLRPGDSILEVNGTPFTSIAHEEALKMLKSCRKISMTVRSPTLPGMLQTPGGGGGPYMLRQTCSWMDRQGRPVSPPPEYSRQRFAARTPSSTGTGAIRRVDLCIEPGQSLGLMIRGGVEYNLGIFITGVDKDSVADRAGLLIGDQILEVNGQSFLDVTHDEAVNQLKFHKRMSLVVRDVGKVPHSCTAYDREIWDATPSGKRSAALQMVEEKARSVLPKSDFPTLCYYTDEYTCRKMSVDAFVAVMMELLNTPEKYTLLTELREIIAPEDRTRFDEIVYRRESDSRIRDHRDYDIRHTSRRKPGLLSDTTNHSLLMSSLHDIPGPDYSNELGYGHGDSDPEYRSPSEDSGLGLAVADRTARLTRRPASATPSCGAWYGPSAPSAQSGGGSVPLQRPTTGPPAIVANTSDLDEETPPTQDYGSGDEGGDVGTGRRHSSPGDSRSGSATALHQPQPEYDDDTSGYLGGLRSWTQKVKSWYWGRPLELAHKLSRSFDMKDDQNLLDAGSDGGSGNIRRHQSMQRLSRTDLQHQEGGEHGDANRTATIVPDHQGNLRITVKKSKPILGIAIEGGANTKHPLPRIINIHENGAAYDAGGLEVGQLILEVDGQRVEGLQHQEVARLIAESFARRDRQEIEFLVVEAKKSNLEPKPTALIFLEA